MKLSRILVVWILVTWVIGYLWATALDIDVYNWNIKSSASGAEKAGQYTAVVVAGTAVSVGLGLVVTVVPLIVLLIIRKRRRRAI